MCVKGLLGTVGDLLQQYVYIFGLSDFGVIPWEDVKIWWDEIVLITRNQAAPQSPNDL
jgi:hypothetical protein